MRVILAGGGTGGHVIPALAIAQELRARYAAEVIFVGTARGIENRLVPAAGYALKLIEVGALKKVSLATRLKTVFALPRAIVASHSILSDFRPDVVIGVGGYASGPTMLAAVISNIPTLAFEPNRVPGLANRLVGIMVSAAVVQFEQTCRYFQNCHVTGIPVRSAFFEARCCESERTSATVGSRMGEHEAAGASGAGAGRHSSPPRKPVLLVFGGSQGAHAINQAVLESLAALTERIPGLHLIHQTGERDYHEAQSAYLHTDVSAEVQPFIEAMPQAFARADLLLCRSGASTVAEIAAAGKPAIFVPFPHAADDHQTRNAEALCEAGAAALLPESELTPARLTELVVSLFADRTRLKGMGEAARKLAHPHAATEIATLAARLAGLAEPEV